MKLFEEYNLAGLRLTSRIVMAPLTRRRATRLNIPVPIMAEYYGQRAGAGLIIAEGASPSPNGVGYCNMPGLFNEAQMEAWKPCTKAVHEQGGRIFLQVMHTGRIGHSNNLLETAKVFGPSAIAHQGEISTYDFEKQAYPIPTEMTLNDIAIAITEYKQCAKLAIRAGFDGIEIHSAHGYLPNQFINESSNIRTDKYGGSRTNRLRFLNEVIDASIEAIGSDKVGLRISPFSYADINENSHELFQIYEELIINLNEKSLAYLHLSHMGEPIPDKFELWKDIRNKYDGTLMLCGDFTKLKAEEALLNSEADLIAFGRDFIANPDLVQRLRHHWPLEDRDRTFWYTKGSKGYIDFENYKN